MLNKLKFAAAEKWFIPPMEIIDRFNAVSQHLLDE